MERLYNTELRKNLEKELYQGDGDRLYDATKLINTVLEHKDCYHVAVTGLKKISSRSEILEPTVIAAVSFCSTMSKLNKIFVSLCVVSEGVFGKEYGAHDGKAWRRRGLMSLLLRICAQLHRSLHQYGSSISVYVSLTTTESWYKIFKKLGFCRSSSNFKECYDCPYVEERDELRLFLDDTKTARHVPFMAEGCVFSKTCK
jgi:hypothetical protein